MTMTLPGQRTLVLGYSMYGALNTGLEELITVGVAEAISLTGDGSGPGRSIEVKIALLSIVTWLRSQ
jgi:hypothetical protein